MLLPPITHPSSKGGVGRSLGGAGVIGADKGVFCLEYNSKWPLLADSLLLLSAPRQRPEQT